MADTYLLNQFITPVGYEIQASMGVDPAQGRIRWPGPVFSIETTEARNKEARRPLGLGHPGVGFHTEGMREYTFEIESMLSVEFSESDINEFISLALGQLQRTIAHDDNPGGILVGEIITGGMSGATGVVVAIDSSTITYYPTSFVEFQDAEVISSTSGSVTSTADPTAIGNVTIRPQALRPIVVEYGWDNYPAGSGSPRFYHKFIDSKIQSLQWTFRQGESIMFKTVGWGRTQSPAEQETSCVGDNVSDLITPLTAAHFADATITFLTVPGGTPINVVVTEFDLVVSNNLERQGADNQSKDAHFLIEGPLDTTFSLKFNKEDNDLLDIFRANSFSDGGKVDVTVVINQNSGFYMSFQMPEVTLKDMSHTLSEDEKSVMEAYGGVLNGLPVVDMSP